MAKRRTGRFGPNALKVARYLRQGDLSYQEIAALVRVSRNTVVGIQHRMKGGAYDAYLEEPSVFRSSSADLTRAAERLALFDPIVARALQQKIGEKP